MIRDSKPFSNGTEYEWFCEQYCEPFPSDCFADLFEPNGNAVAFNVCRHFWANNDEEQFAYFRMFKDAICGKEQK